MINCLNPCCSGQWSRTYHTRLTKIKLATVLILVVVDNGLVPDEIDFIDASNGLS